MIPLSDLTPHPQNAQLRTITPEALDGLKANILKGSTHVAREANDSETEILRLQESITINRNGNRILGGHRRIEALQSLGQTQLHPDDITWVEYDPDSPEEEEALIQLNNAEIQGTWLADPLRQRLTAIKQALAPGEYETTRLAELQAKLAELPKPPTQPGKDTPPPDLGTEGETYTPITQPGDLINLGPHRLLCGDATKEEDIRRLMGEEEAEGVACLTDPPYNVGYEYEATEDDLAPEAYREFTASWFNLIASRSQLQILTPGIANVPLWFKTFQPLWVGAWWKRNSMKRGSMVANFNTWEPLLFFGKLLKPPPNLDSIDAAISPQKDAEAHPTPKPLKLYEEIIEGWGKTLILDPFLGSGTTLIACQNLDRTCYGIEISPQYCDVTIARFLKHTGPENHPDLAKKFAPLFS